VAGIENVAGHSRDGIFKLPCQSFTLDRQYPGKRGVRHTSWGLDQ